MTKAEKLEKEKRGRFAAEYLLTMNLEKAARAAGYEPSAELLEKCRGELSRQRELLSAEITGEDVLRRLQRLGFGTGEELEGILSGEMEGLDLSMVSEVKRGSNGTVELKLINRVDLLLRLWEILQHQEDGAEEFLKSLQAEGDSCEG